MRILIADDSRTMRKVFRNLLETMGYKTKDILEATDSVEALSLLKTHNYDVDMIIADLDMPGMEGHAFLKRVKESGREMPILLCINPNQQTYAREAFKFGATDLLERPFRDTQLRDKVKEVETKVRRRKTQETSAFLKTIVSAAEAEVELPFLMQLPSFMMKELLQMSVHDTFEAGVTLLEKGEAVEALHVITLGEVELVDENGRVLETCMTGDCFGEIAFMEGVPAHETARAKTWAQVISLPRHKLGELLRTQPKMSSYLSQLVARRTKSQAVLPKIQGASDFTGSLKSMNFADVLQILTLGQKTGVLTLSREGGGGEIRLQDGEVSQAIAGKITGDEAFYAMAGWKNATFAFATKPIQGKKNVSQPTMSLLMEAMRRVDESTRGGMPPSQDEKLF